MKHFLFKYREVITTLIVFAVMLLPLVTLGDTFQPSGTTFNSSQSVPTGGSSAGSNMLQNPLGGINSVCKLVVALLSAVMLIGIPVAVLFIVWAGFRFVLARGNPTAIGEARSNFLNVVIGIGIFIGASLIASVILNTLQQLGVQNINSC